MYPINYSFFESVPLVPVYYGLSLVHNGLVFLAVEMAVIIVAFITAYAAYAGYFYFFVEPDKSKVTLDPKT